jgi:predicted nucleic acid-binding protein
VSALVVDTSVWVDFFRGDPLPDLELALREGLIVLPPLVVAELLSAPLRKRQREELTSLLTDLPLHATPFDHWRRVGELRAGLARRALTVSAPDAHVAQCAIDLDARLWSRDTVFAKVATKSPLRLFSA